MGVLMGRFRSLIAVAVVGLALVAGSLVALPARPAEAALPAWASELETLFGTKAISVAVADGGRYLYRHGSSVQRIPASVEKLLLSMPLLTALGPSARIPTDALGELSGVGVISGNLWVRGRGDPTTGGGQMLTLAKRLVARGVTKVSGSILGDTSTFSRDWWATGWKENFPRDEVAMPTALTFKRNRTTTGPITDPEVRAAASLTTALESLGVEVVGAPGSGRAPRDVPIIASVQSRSLEAVLGTVLANSDNFGAEVLGKMLAYVSGIRPATIVAGAGVAVDYAAERDVPVVAYDSSGLSSSNRVTAAGLVLLLGLAEQEDWGEAFIGMLPAGGEGTLLNRFADIDVHAKTGTISGVSTLAGWVWSESRQSWIEFAILSQNVAKDTAIRIEDQIVRTIAGSA
ncbi:MAG: D-alanyl-D-alanine carboxypeptidase/D-alanyl-D-alanine-endopeptidase [Actinomycetota bacterium]